MTSRIQLIRQEVSRVWFSSLLKLFDCKSHKSFSDREKSENSDRSHTSLTDVTWIDSQTPIFSYCRYSATALFTDYARRWNEQWSEWQSTMSRWEKKEKYFTSASLRRFRLILSISVYDRSEQPEKNTKSFSMNSCKRWFNGNDFL